VDTSDPGTARRALDEGADMINDITALSDPGMAALAAETGTPVILMHMKGTPRDMQIDPAYDDVVGEVLGFLEERLASAKEAGIPESHLLADPGIGFGKRIVDNLALIRRLGEFRCLGVPLVLGHSRKSFLGALTGVGEAGSRDPATAALSALAARDADILRVHDVPGTVQAVRVALAVHGGKPG
jgi:dihydropteroate synthase